MDTLGNEVSSGQRDDATDSFEPRLDYRVLQPSLVTDPNGNRSEVAFDALGMVVGTAVMGKVGEHRGDLLDDTFERDLPDSRIVGYFAAPVGKEAGSWATRAHGSCTTSARSAVPGS